MGNLLSNNQVLICDCRELQLVGVTINAALCIIPEIIRLDCKLQMFK